VKAAPEVIPNRPLLSSTPPMVSKTAMDAGAKVEPLGKIGPEFYGAQNVPAKALEGSDFKKLGENIYVGADGVVYKHTPNPANPENVMLWPQGKAAPPDGFMGPTGRMSGQTLEPKALEASGYKPLGDNLYLKDGVVYKAESMPGEK